MQRIERYGSLVVGPVSDGGASQRLQALADLGKSVSDMAFQYGAKKRTAEGSQAGFEQGKKAAESGTIPQEKTGVIPTIYGEAFNNAQQSAYIASVDRRAVERLSEIEAEHSHDPEAYTKISESMLGGLMESAPESYKPVLTESINNYISRGKMRVNQNVVKRGEEEAKSELTGAIETYSKEASRSARNGDFDSVDDLISKAEMSSDAMVAGGFWTKEEADQTVTGVRKEVFRQENKRDILETAKTDPVEAQKKLSELEKEVPETYSPDEWERVVDDIRTDLSRLIPRKGGSTRESNDWLRKAKGSVKNGFQISEADKAKGGALLIGTDKQDEYDRLLKMEQFSLLSSKQRNEILSQTASHDSMEGQQDHIQFQAVHDNLTKMAESDGMTLALKQGRLEPAKIENADMTERNQQAEDLSAVYGVTVSPFMDSEIQELVASMSNMAPTDKATLAITLGGNEKTYQQLDKKNASMFAMLAARGDEDLANAVFMGEELIKTKQVSIPKRSDYAELVDEYLGEAGDVYGIEDRATIIKTALNYYASMGDPEYNENSLEKALEAVTGGIGEINDSKVELPRDVPESLFEDFVDSLQPETILKAGGLLHPFPIEKVRDARFVSLGDSRYALEIGGKRQYNKDRDQFVIEVTPEMLLFNESAKPRVDRRGREK